MATTVSVVIPTKNEERNIERCIMALFNQDFPRSHLEIIVVDNFSTDATATIARGLGVSVSPRGPERNGQRRYGASLATGKYTMFLDADMELESSLIAEAVAQCEANGFVALVLPEMSVGAGFWAACRAFEKQCYLNDDMMETANRFIRRDVYEAVGGYDDALIVGEDFDLGDRIRDHGYRIGRTDAMIRHHEVRSFSEMIRKHFYYGQQMPTYLNKSRGTGFKRFFIIRRAYLRNWRLFVRDPLHGMGFIAMKALQYAAAGAGFGTAVVSSKCRGMGHSTR